MQAWEKFLCELEKDLGKDTVVKWLRPLKVARYDAGNLYLEAENSFQAAWFEEHIRPRLRYFVNNNQRPIKVRLTANASPAGKKEIFNQTLLIESDDLHPHYTLSYFAETEENKLAFRLLCDLAGFQPENGEADTKPNLSVFNPLYIYGGKGSGKTHLLMAACARLRQKGLNVFFANADTFTEHVVHAIRLGKMEEFRKAYRHIDVLAIDDVHIFARKAATQEEFFHTFNTLHTMGKQILLSSKCPPAELTEIEPRLVSRFEWGLSLSLPKPSKELLNAVLTCKARLFQITLKEEMTAFLLNSFSNPIELAQALETISLQKNLSHKPMLSLPSIEGCLKDLLEKKQKEALSPTRILKIVSDHFGLKTADLQGKGQNREISLPRQIVMFFCRTRLKMPFMKIGEFFERDHSTVITSIKLIEKAIESKNEETLQAILQIEKQLEG
jgi:chromosomal replication initiator protein